MNASLLILGAYVLFQLVLGYVVSRGVNDELDYLVGGRKLGPALTGASVFATWFGAETCVGAAGEVYRRGLAAVSADPFGYGLCVVLFGFVLAGPLWKRGLVTLADLFRDRFSVGVERLVSALLIPGSVLWAAAQMRAFGHVLTASADLDPTWSLALAAAVCVGYTALGGLLADAYTDLVQGGVLVGSLVVLMVVSLANADLSAVMEAAKVTDPNAPSMSPFVMLEHWAVPILGSLFAQELVARVLGARTRKVARNSTIVAGVVYLMVGVVPVVLGLVGRVDVPGLASGEQVLPALAEKHLGALGQAILSGALVSAILSTVDSALLVSGGLISHNLIGKRVKISPLVLARGSVISLGLIAYVLAQNGDSVHELVEQASAFGSAGVVVTGLFGLFTRRGGTPSAMAALVSGALVYGLAEYVLHLEVSFLASLAAAVVAYLALSGAPQGPVAPPTPPEVPARSEA